jgi:hypothetical protein
MPVPEDYDWDGRLDIAVYRPSSGIWYVIPSGKPTTFTLTQWGTPTDVPVAGDYDGDGKSDMAVWRPDSGIWYVLLSSSPGSYTCTQWGVSDDVPVPEDFDGDGKMDIAVWRPSNGVWYVIPSTAPFSYYWTQWGLSTDLPILPLTRILGVMGNSSVFSASAILASSAESRSASIVGEKLNAEFSLFPRVHPLSAAGLIVGMAEAAPWETGIRYREILPAEAYAKMGSTDISPEILPISWASGMMENVGGIKTGDVGKTRSYLLQHR